MANTDMLRLPAEELFQNEIEALIKAEKDPVPSGWAMSPRSVLTYIMETLLSSRFGGHTESQELGLPVTQSGLILPCGATGRWTAGQ